MNFTSDDGSLFGVGIGNSSETTYGVADKYFVYDNQTGTMPFVIDSPTGNIGIGTTSPQATLDIAGAGSGNFGREGALSLLETNSDSAWQMIFRDINAPNLDIGLIKADDGLFLKGVTSGNDIMSWHASPTSGGFGTTTATGDFQTLDDNFNSLFYVDGATDNIGIGTTTPFSRLTVWGPNSSAGTAALTISNSASTTELQVFDNGNATLAGTLTQNSDVRLKTNVQRLDASSSLSAIDALNPVTFNWIDPNQGSGPQVGFIAQQVQAIFPNLVSTTSPTDLTPGGTLGLNYIGLISPIVSAIQALYSNVQSLEQTVSGFAESFVSNRITASQELCVGSTCVTSAQFQAMVAAANQSPSAAQPSPAATSSLPKFVTQNSASTTPAVQISEPTTTISGAGSSTPPTITINGDNPAVIQIGDSYADLGATVSDTGSGQAGDTNLGIKTFLNGTLVSNIVIDTSSVATNTIDYAATDQAGLTSTSSRTVLIEDVASLAPTATTTDATSTTTAQ